MFHTHIIITKHNFIFVSVVVVPPLPQQEDNKSVCVCVFYKSYFRHSVPGKV
jgi:hypothetical protein